MAGRPWTEEEEKAVKDILESELEWDTRQACARAIAGVLPDRTHEAVDALIARRGWEITLRGPRVDCELLRKMTSLEEAV